VKVYQQFLTYRKFIFDFKEFSFIKIFSASEQLYIAYRGETRNRINLRDLDIMIEYLKANSIWNYKKIEFEEIKFSYDRYYIVFDFKKELAA